MLFSYSILFGHVLKKTCSRSSLEIGSQWNPLNFQKKQSQPHKNSKIFPCLDLKRKFLLHFSLNVVTACDNFLSKEMPLILICKFYISSEIFKKDSAQKYDRKIKTRETFLENMDALIFLMTWLIPSRLFIVTFIKLFFNKCFSMYNGGFVSHLISEVDRM